MSNISGLINPTVLTTPGPTFATMQNTEMDLIDAHDHSSGKGAQLTISGLGTGLVDADMSFTGFGPINQSYSRFTSGGAVSAANSIYVVSGSPTELWFKPSTGAAVQLTVGNTINSVAGTNNFSGIYDKGAGTGYSNGGTAHEATLGYDGARHQYRFTNDPNDFSAGGTNAATVAVGSLWIASTQAFPFRIGKLNSWDNNAANQRPQGGFGMGNVATAGGDSLVVGADPTNAGTYSTTTAFRVDAITSATGYSYGLGINYGAANAGPVPHALGINSAAVAGSAVASVVAEFGSNVSGGAILAGFGTQVLLRAPAAAASGFTQVTQGAVTSRWQTTVGTNGGIDICGALSGTLSATAGVQVRNYAGTDCIGLGGAAAGGILVSLYGDIVPDVDNTHDIGASGLTFRDLWATRLRSNTTVSLTGSTVIISAAATVGTTLGVTGAITGSSTITGTAFIPSTTNASFTGSIFKNTQIVAYGIVDTSANITQRFNAPASGSWGVVGTFTVTLSGSVPSAAVVIVTANTGAIVLTGIRASVSGNVMTVYTTDGSTGLASTQPFQFIILGAP